MEALLKASAAGHSVLCVASISFVMARPASRGVTQLAPRFPWDDEVSISGMRNGGDCFPDLADGPNQRSAFKHVDSRRAESVKVAVDSSAEEARGVATIIHVKLGQASAHHPKRPLVCAAEVSKHLLGFADEKAGQREGC